MIAPTLRRMRYLMEADRTKNPHAFRCLRELRALLAVAEAAKGVFDPEDKDDPALSPPWKAMDRALARLERVSKEKP